MTDVRKKAAPLVPAEFGVPIESALAKRERFANQYDYDYGQERIFLQLVPALLEEIPDESDLLEVGAATGLMTGPLLSKATSLTALEPSPGLLRRLVSSDVASDARLGTMLGMAEDLSEDVMFDIAVVTFTPRRGIGLLHLLTTLARHVRDRVVMMLDDDGTLDWAYLARAAAIQGFDVRMHLVCETGVTEDPRRAVILVAVLGSFDADVAPEDIWEFESRTLEVPYPAPRGAATRVVRYFMTAGERVLLVRTPDQGMERLYGNLRTAVHRLGRDEVTVRRIDEGIQIVRLPKPIE
ncbi:MAG: hypothetical protein HGB10_10650 [Coriobacteriia bacterium]|nr:hypothetical protein [Coriobacteriia bacterium]